MVWCPQACRLQTWRLMILTPSYLTDQPIRMSTSQFCPLWTITIKLLTIFSKLGHIVFWGWSPLCPPLSGRVIKPFFFTSPKAVLFLFLSLRSILYQCTEKLSFWYQLAYRLRAIKGLWSRLLLSGTRRPLGWDSTHCCTNVHCGSDLSSSSTLPMVWGPWGWGLYTLAEATFGRPETWLNPDRPSLTVQVAVSFGPNLGTARFHAWCSQQQQWFLADSRHAVRSLFPFHSHLRTVHLDLPTSPATLNELLQNWLYSIKLWMMTKQGFQPLEPICSCPGLLTFLFTHTPIVLLLISKLGSHTTPSQQKGAQSDVLMRCRWSDFANLSGEKCGM